jgi:hypothetical protein
VERARSQDALAIASADIASGRPTWVDFMDVPELPFNPDPKEAAIPRARAVCSWSR